MLHDGCSLHSTVYAYWHELTILTLVYEIIIVNSIFIFKEYLSNFFKNIDQQ